MPGALAIIGEPQVKPAFRETRSSIWPPDSIAPYRSPFGSVRSSENAGIGSGAPAAVRTIGHVEPSSMLRARYVAPHDTSTTSEPSGVACG
ncbi:MAG: hypothetical protein ACXVES_13355 [Actinomycetota bacterium]